MTEIQALGGRNGACVIKSGVSLPRFYQPAWRWKYSSKLETDPAINNEPMLTSAYVVVYEGQSWLPSRDGTGTYRL